MDKSEKKFRRLEQLDALRGIAALAVVLSHYALLFGPDSPFQVAHAWIEALSWTPLFAAFSGRQAVSVFFILSGFVLTVMLDRVHGYIPYLWRRVTRLYLPYIVALALSISIKTLVYRGPVPELGEWFNLFWGIPTTLDSVLRHASFVGHFDTRQYNYAIWSLVQEMRISIIFPLLLMTIKLVPWRMALGWSLLLSALGGAGYFLFYQYGWPFWANDVIILHYILHFVVGILMALNQEGLGRWVRRLTRRQTVALVVIGVVSYTYGTIGERYGVTNPVINDWPSLPGAALLVLAALNSSRVIGWLVRPVPLFLGRISYSLYLIHPVVQLGMMYAWYDRIPLFFLILLSLGVTVLTAFLLYHFVEVPSIALGRRWFTSRKADRD